MMNKYNTAEHPFLAFDKLVQLSKNVDNKHDTNNNVESLNKNLL